MGWISKLFKPQQKVADPSNSTGFHDLDGSPVPLKPLADDVRKARELINKAAIETALVCGVPATWLSFEVVTISDHESAYFQLQVVMNRWDEYLAAHSYAFERAVVKRISEKNLNVVRAMRAVLWRTAPDAGCPYDDMPEAQAWGSEAVKKRAQARDRMNRDLYTLSASPAGAAVPIHMPFSADQADGSNPSDKYRYLLDDSAYDDNQPSSVNDFAATQAYSPNAHLPDREHTRPSTFNGFAATRPYSPLLEEPDHSDELPSTFNGFAATQPYSTLMADVIVPPKK